MTKNYFQLTLSQRYQIEYLKKSGIKQYEIAKAIGVHKSTISKELNRNVPKRGTGAKVYAAQKAQAKTDNRHKIKAKQVLFTPALKAVVLKKMTVDRWSPELISAQWEKEKKPGVSHETIYKFLWETKFGNKKKNEKFKILHKFLKHGKRRRKRGNYRDNRGLIPNRVSIEKRSSLVDRRKRLGDKEVDLIIGKNHKSGLLVTLDRATMKTTIDKINSKKPKHIKRLIIKRMKNKYRVSVLFFIKVLCLCPMHAACKANLFLQWPMCIQ